MIISKTTSPAASQSFTFVLSRRQHTHTDTHAHTYAHTHTYTRARNGSTAARTRRVFLCILELFFEAAKHLVKRNARVFLLPDWVRGVGWVSVANDGAEQRFFFLIAKQRKQKCRNLFLRLKFCAVFWLLWLCLVVSAKSLRLRLCACMCVCVCSTVNFLSAAQFSWIF